MIAGQTIIIVVGGIAPDSIGAAFSVNKIGGTEWAISIVIGFLSIPIGAAIRLIPDELILRLVPDYIKNHSKNKPKFTIEDEEHAQFYFPAPLQEVREELSFMKKFKGGRLNNLKFAMTHPVEAVMHNRSRSQSRSGSQPQTPSDGVSRENSFRGQGSHDIPRTPESRKSRERRSRSNSALGATTVMAGIIAGSVAGWSPIDRREGENDSIRFSRSRGRSDLESRDGVEVHPQTEPSAPIIVEEPTQYGMQPSQVEEITPAVGVPGKK